MARSKSNSSNAFGSGSGRAPVIPSSIGDPSKDNSGIWDVARNLANKGIAVANLKTTSGTSVLKGGMNDLLQSMHYYQDLIDIVGPGSKDYNTLVNERDSVLEKSYDLAKRIQGNVTMSNYSSDPLANLAANMNKSSIGEPTIAIVTDSPEDAAIVKKIESAIVTRNCGFRTFDDYAGSKEIREFFQSVAIDRFKYDQFQQAHPGTESVLLFGPPGTGKTLLAEAVASELAPFGASFISISSSDIKGRFVGESEKGLKYLFAVARKLTVGGTRPCVIFMDEIDGLIDDAGVSGGGGTGLLSEFNSQMQGVKGESNKGLVVIAATNYPEKIPPAAFQRFTHRIFIGLPSVDNIREIVIGKLQKMGWSRVNFVTSKFPKWMQTIDWERKTYIENFITDDSKLTGWKTATLKENERSNFWKTSTQEDKERFTGLMDVSIGDDIFDFDANGMAEACPWDVADCMTYFLWSNYYAPREIDAVFAMMMIRAEQRSVFFAERNLSNQSKVYYQKWLLEKRTLMRDVEKNNTCVKEKVVRFAMLPLWYTTADEGKDGSIESKFLRNTDSDVMFGNVLGYKRLTSSDGTFTDSIVPKYNLDKKDRSNECKVVVTKVTLTEQTPVSKEIREGVKSKITRKFAIERKQVDGISLTRENVEGSVYVPTVTWNNIPEDERLSPDNIHRVLGISQITIFDFLEALSLIRSIAVRNVKSMIDYAKNYGRSVKGGSDILQLENQAALMEQQNQLESSSSNSRYPEIFRQFVDALSSVSTTTTTDDDEPETDKGVPIKKEPVV